jgi:hypothetical protein
MRANSVPPRTTNTSFEPRLDPLDHFLLIDSNNNNDEVIPNLTLLSHTLAHTSRLHSLDMKSLSILVCLVVCACANAFAVAPLSSMSGGSSFVVSRKAPGQRTHQQSAHVCTLRMGSQAKFGIFSPAVYIAKAVLGGDKLNKIRGKAISLHSQYIGDFCEWAGAYYASDGDTSESVNVLTDDC